MSDRAPAMTDHASVDGYPAGLLAEVADVLRRGGERHGVGASETGGGQTAIDHLAHAIDHVHNVMDDFSAGRPVRIDPSTGRSELVHALARLVLVRGLEPASAGGSGQR